MPISDWSSDVCSSDLLHASMALVVQIERDELPRLRRQRIECGEVVGRDFYVAVEIARRRGQAAFDRQLTDHVDRVQDQVEMLIRREPDAQRLRRAVEIEVRQFAGPVVVTDDLRVRRSEEHTSELQSLMRISYAVFCLKKKTKQQQTQSTDYYH